MTGGRGSDPEPPSGFEQTDLARTDSGPAPSTYLGRGGGAGGPGPGDVVDRYRIVAVLGEGAMGVVFRATDGDLRRDVALKLLRPGAGGEAARARLLDAWERQG